MKPKDAIKAINNINKILNSSVNSNGSLDYDLTLYDIDWLEKAKEALEKQIVRIAKPPQPGERFVRGGIEFIVLGMEQGGVLAVTAKQLNDEMAYDENGSNDWRKSSLRKYLNEKFVKNFDKGDLLPFVSDLTSDDGMTDYGTSEDFVALLSDNLYRKYRKFMPIYDTWVWTITPWSCLPGYASYERTVRTSGALYSGYTSNSYGVAPACIFNPEIFADRRKRRKKCQFTI